jgi:hypothetical protein
MASVINWQTGTPERSGQYLVTLSTGEVTVMEWYNPYTSSPYWLDKEGEVVAWCDFKDVEPYQETTGENN